MGKEKAEQIPLEVWQDPQGDVILNISERECNAYFGCWNEDSTPADYIAKISFIGCKSSIFSRSEFLDYDYEHLYHSYILRVLNSKWLEAQINKDNKLYPHNRKLINDYNHYVIKGHDVFIEVIARDFILEKINKENAGEYARLSDEA
jgi:hypothetical protein